MKAGPTKPAKQAQVVTGRYVRQVTERLDKGLRVRRNLPVWGRIAVDRPLPFLCVYRRPAARPDEGTDLLVTSEASYLTCMATGRQLPGVRELIRSLAATMVREFGTFLLLEVWAGPALPQDESWMNGTPNQRFRIVAPKRQGNEKMTEQLVHAFGVPRPRGIRSDVRVSPGGRRGPPKMPPLLTAADEAELGCHLYGLEVAPIYRGPTEGELFPLVLKDLRRSLTLALRRMFYEFTTVHTTHQPPHFHAMGRRALVKAVWEADRHLADAAEKFDLLLMITPVNGEAAWHEFRRRRYQHRPGFHYRPLPADPVVLKRAVYRAPVERIEDPALAQVFREKQAECPIPRISPSSIPRNLRGSGGETARVAMSHPTLFS